MVGIEKPKIEKTLPKYMKLPELQQFFRYLERLEQYNGLRNEMMFKMIAMTGMRHQEVVDLTWEQYDPHANTIRIHGKGSKERIIPVHQVFNTSFRHA